MKESIRRNAVTIAVAAVTAMVFGGGSFAVAAGINASRLNGYKAKQLIRVAEAHCSTTPGTPCSTGNATLDTLSITAPKNGYLVLHASVDNYDYTGATSQPACRLRLDTVALTHTFREIELTPTNQEENCQTEATWPVAKGTHLVDFEMFISQASVKNGPSSLTALFVPFDGMGVVPIPVPPAAPAGDASGNA
jgi:hypothetical protein